MKSSVTSQVIVRTRSARNMKAPLSTHTKCTPFGWSLRDLPCEGGDALSKLLFGNERLHVSTPPRTDRAAGTRLSGRARKGNIAPDRETFSDDHRSRRARARVRHHDRPGCRWSHHAARPGHAQGAAHHGRSRRQRSRCRGSGSGCGDSYRGHLRRPYLARAEVGASCSTCEAGA